MADKRLSVIITGNATAARKAFGSLEKSAAKSGKRTESALSGIAGGLADIGVAAAAFSAFSAFDESQRVARQTEAVIRSTGGAANITADGVAKLAGELSKKSAVDDEVIQSGANVLGTFTRIRNEVGKGNDIFNQATEAALDLSVAMGTDMKSASVLVGKALNDPMKGMTSLTRAGVQFTAQQKDQIRTLTESGRTLDAQKVILAELETQFGGSAEAQATSLGRAKVAVGNLAESVGGVLAPALEAGSDAVSGLADGFGELSEGAQQAVVGGAALGYAALRWGPQIMGAASAAKTAGGNMVAFGQLAAEAMRTRSEGVSRIAAAFDTVSVAAPNATARTTKLVNAMGGIQVAGPAAAAGLGLVAFALVDYMGKSERAKANTEALRQAFEDGEKPLDALNKKLARTLSGADGGFELNTSGDKFRRYVDTVGLSADDLSDILSMSRSDFEKWRNEQQNMGGENRLLANHLDGLNSQYVDAQGKQKALEANTRALAGETARLGGEVDGTSGAMDEAGGSTDALTSRIEAGRAAADAYANEQERATQALKDFYDASTAALSGAIGAEAALDGLTEAAKENGTSLDINTEKGRANQQAFIAAKDAAVEHATAVMENGGTAEQAAGVLQDYAFRLMQTAHEAGYSEKEIRWMIGTMKLTPKDIKTRFQQNAPEAGSKVAGYIGTIGRVQPSKTTDFYANISPALYNIGVLQQKMANMGSGSMWVLGGQRAKGGPVAAGVPYLVGEQGPEIVVPKSDGMVLTAGQTKRAMSAGSPMSSAVAGGASVAVTVNVAGSIHATEDVAHAVRNVLIDYGRRTGKPILAGLA